MVFFAESIKAKNGSGVIGLRATLRANNLQLPQELPKYVSAFISECEQNEKAFTIGFLSEKPYPLGFYIWCHGHIESERITHFSISLGRKPKAEPPQKLIEDSKKLGGYPLGFSEFISIMGSHKIKGEASLVAVIADSKRWHLKFEKSKLPKKVGAFKLECEDITFENNADKVKVSFMPDERTFCLEINSRVEMNLSDSCFDDLSEILWEKANSLFIKK